MDWNGAALTLMPPLCRGLEPDWNACVWEAGGRAVDGGGCSVRGIEAYIQNNNVRYSAQFIACCMSGQNLTKGLSYDLLKHCSDQNKCQV